MNKPSSTALATTHTASLAAKIAEKALAEHDAEFTSDMDLLVESGLLTREQIQMFMAQVLGNAKVPGGSKALKATRVARAFMRLAAMAEDAAGYGKDEYMTYASKAFDKQIGSKAKKALPAAKATPSLGAAKPGAKVVLASVKPVKVYVKK